MFSWPHFFEGIGMALTIKPLAKAGYPFAYAEKALLHDWKSTGREVQSVINKETQHDRRNKHKHEETATETTSPQREQDK